MIAERIKRSVFYAAAFLAALFGLSLGIGYLSVGSDSTALGTLRFALGALLLFPLPLFNWLFPPPADCLVCSPPTAAALAASVLSALTIYSCLFYAFLSWGARRDIWRK